MGLLVDQYKDGGMKILDNHTQVRINQKVQMGNDISEKRLELAQVYTNARISVENRKRDNARLPVNNFEKQWHKEQEVVQAKLSQRRRSFL